jgi:hypothetical protein
MMLTVACAKPQIPKRKVVKTRDIKHAIKHATNLCYNYENTPECRSAWELVEELTTAHVHQTARMLEAPRDDPLEERIYDL